MTKRLTALRQCLLDPGVIFPCANLFAFMQSHDLIAILLAVMNVVISIGASLFIKGDKRLLAFHPQRGRGVLIQFFADQLYSPLRITALFALGAGFAAFVHDAFLPAMAGFAFGFGNWLASSPTIEKLKTAGRLHGWVSVLVHPAIYYGIGYSMTGLMAGGGIAILQHPDHNLAASLATALGITVTTLSSIGLVTGFFNQAMPFWLVAGGSAINSIAGLLSGNIMGTVNCILSMFGELRLGFLTWVSLRGSLLHPHK